MSNDNHDDADTDDIAAAMRDCIINVMDEMPKVDPEVAKIFESPESFDEFALIQAIQKNPLAAKAQYGNWWLGEFAYPLSLSVERNASFDAIQFLYKIYPQAVEEEDFRSNSLLHIACCFIKGDDALKIMKLLVGHYPEALYRRNEEDRIPLHEACQHQSFEVVSYLLDQYSSSPISSTTTMTAIAAVEKKDEDGRTPLHLACRYSTSVDVVSALLDICPSAIAEKDENGGTALHAACVYNKSFKIVCLLLEKCPHAVLEQDVEGFTPFEIAGVNEASESILSILRGITRLVQKEATVNRAVDVQILKDFIALNWAEGIIMAFDLYPPIVQALEDILPMEVNPYLLCKIGYKCRFFTLWNVICNRQDLLKIT